MRRLSVALSLAVLVGICVVAARRRHDGGGSPYVIMPADRGPITARVTATGTVTPLKTVQVGTYVTGPLQATLFLVAEDLTKMQVSASVSESDIGPVAAAQRVSFSVDAYPATTFAGRVEQVRNAPITVQNVVTYDVVVSVDNRDLLLKPGMTANVTIATATRPDTLRVSTSALRFRPPAEGDGGAAAAQAPAELSDRHGARVWVLDESGRPRPVEVRTGIADDRFTEIIDRLGPGAPVIVALRREDTDAPAAGRAPSFAPARRGAH